MLNSKKVCIFVDGENLRHSICDLFPTFNRSDYLPKANWGEFFDWISESVVGTDCDRIRTYWYAVQNLDFYPFQLNSAKNNGSYDYLYKILSKNTGKDLETIAQDTERDYFMDSNEAFDYGIVDKVLDNEKISE